MRPGHRAHSRGSYTNTRRKFDGAESSRRALRGEDVLLFEQLGFVNAMRNVLVAMSELPVIRGAETSTTRAQDVGMKPSVVFAKGEAFLVRGTMDRFRVSGTCFGPLDAV